MVNPQISPSDGSLCVFRLIVNTDSGNVNTDSGFARKVFTFNQNPRSRSTGIRVHDQPEYAEPDATMSKIVF